MRAALHSSRRGTAWHHLSDRERTRLIVAEVSKECTKWMKRLRKSADHPPITYLMVFEPHKDGTPHVHALIHERDLFRPVTYRQITGAWHYGFAHAKLVDSSTGEQTAGYVAKYISKSMAGRVRASLGYGDQPLEPLAQSEA